MKKPTFLFPVFFCAAVLFTTTSSVNAQAFRKGSFVINLSEGSTNANYRTYNSATSIGEGGHIIGTRDPLALEYGLSNHFGIGLTTGTDFYLLNPEQFYNFSPSTGQVKAITTELTIDGYYHFIVTEKMDFSAVLSYGGSGVYIKGNNGDEAYQYNSMGHIVRLGVHGRFLIGHHFGFLAMVSAFSQTASTQNAPPSTFGQGYSTTICGIATEFGFCYRIGRR